MTLDGVTLVAADGADAARGRLGRAGAFRAVRLDGPAEPAAGDDARALPDTAPADLPAGPAPELRTSPEAASPAAETEPDRP